MGSIAIVGLDSNDQGVPDARAVARLRQATTVVIPSTTGASAAMLSSLGITPLAFTGLGITENASTADVVEALLRLAQTGDVVLVTEGRATHASADVLPVTAPPPAPTGPTDGFAEFVGTIARLRAPDGCPWDREQTHASLAPHLVEEAYEAVAAIDSGEPAAIADELGDVLLQVVLNAQIGTDEGAFTIDDVIAGISAKIRRRHPHIFGTAVAETSADVTRTWDAVKRGERRGGGVVADVPVALPALMRAQKISRRAAAAGFEWEDLAGVWEKVYEEIEELTSAEPGTPEAAEELGDVLFTVVNVARKMGIDSETALRRACDRFSRRFAQMEREAGVEGRALGSLTAAEWEGLWDSAKRVERSGDVEA